MSQIDRSLCRGLVSRSVTDRYIAESRIKLSKCHELICDIRVWHVLIKLTRFSCFNVKFVRWPQWLRAHLNVSSINVDSENVAEKLFIISVIDISRIRPVISLAPVLKTNFHQCVILSYT